jgi:hypothetical protein
VRRGSAFTLATILLIGCSSGQGGSLPTYEPGPFCSTAELLPLRIAGDATKTPPLWGVTENGLRIDLLWPLGFSMRAYGGRLEVLDPQGLVVARQGDRLVGAGGGHVNGQPNAPFEICQIGNKFYTGSAAPPP